MRLFCQAHHKHQSFGKTRNNFSVKVTDSDLAFADLGPFTVDVIDAPTVALTSTSVDGTKGQAGVEVNLPIQARDANGNNQHTGGDVFSATVADGANTGQPVTIVDNADGTYTLKYTPFLTGTDFLRISFFDNNFPGFVTIGPSSGIYSVSISAGVTDPAQTVVTVPDGAVGLTTTISAIPNDA